MSLIAIQLPSDMPPDERQKFTAYMNMGLDQLINHGVTGQVLRLVESVGQPQEQIIEFVINRLAVGCEQNEDVGEVVQEIETISGQAHAFACEMILLHSIPPDEKTH